MSAFNEVTGAEYQGRNVLRLLTAELENDYSDAHGWAGFGQWKSVGRVVRKGEHGTACLTVMADKSTDDVPAGKGRGVRGFRVFHYDQTTELVAREDRPAEVHEVAHVVADGVVVAVVEHVDVEPDPVAEDVTARAAHPTGDASDARAALVAKLRGAR